MTRSRRFPLDYKEVSMLRRWVLILVLAGGLLLAACGPVATPQPAPTLTPTPRTNPALMAPITPEELSDADFDKIYEYILTLEQPQ